MEISKEFINAMNGVLNGEKWRRKTWNQGVYLTSRSGKTWKTKGTPVLNRFQEDKRYSNYFVRGVDLFATDWVKVEEKKTIEKKDNNYYEMGFAMNKRDITKKQFDMLVKKMQLIWQDVAPQFLTKQKEKTK